MNHSQGRQPSTQIQFEKVEACGNDMILVYDTLPSGSIKGICDRHHGLGADGVMVFMGSDSGTVMFDHYDADGSRSFCLNGIRAALDCLIRKGIIPREGRFSSEAVTGPYRFEKGRVLIRLSKRAYQPMVWRMGDREIAGFFAEVGNPQFVVTKPLEESSFREIAPPIRADRATFPSGTNVSLVRPVEKGWRIITFERGVEDFTLACGSGMFASALVLVGESEVRHIRFFPEGRGSVDFRVEANEFEIVGDTHWVASGVWLCGS